MYGFIKKTEFDKEWLKVKGHDGETSSFGNSLSEINYPTVNHVVKKGKAVSKYRGNLPQVKLT